MVGAPGSGPSAVELNFTAPFGVVLRGLRKAVGWTQLRLAGEVHRDHTAISRWEKGTLCPDADDVGRVVEALRLEWLVEAIRAVAINSGLVGDEVALHRAWSRFREVEGDIPDNLHRFALEGFVRGFTPIAADQAFEIVDDAIRAVDGQVEPSVVRRVQLARAEGHLVAHVSGTVPEGETRRRLERALAMSRALELSKYVIELEGLLVLGGDQR